MIVHASISEKGTITGSAGDQTGKEVCVRTYYAKGWQCMIRHPDPAVGKKAAEIGQMLAQSNLVGYDQGGRNTLYKALKKNGFNVEKYIQSGEKTECDCSSFIYACYSCVLMEMRSDVNAPTTSVMKSRYSMYGFDIKTEPKYLTSDEYLKIGDILLKPGSHTVMNITEGKNTGVAPVQQKKTVTIVAKSGLKIRSGPGTTYNQIGGLANGSKTEITEIKSGWGKLANRSGWICLKYTK